MRPLRYLLFPAILLALPSCSQSRFESASEGEKLLRRDAEWADLAAAGKDVDKVVSYWSDDAIVIFPGQPEIEGKAAIRAYVTECFNTPGFKIHWVSQKPAFSPDSKMAYMRGSDEATVPGPDGRPMTLHSRGVSIWRLDSDGQWRCVADVSSEAPSATPKS
jgi:uncharacterized protein (TIGR02246 family)